MDVRMPDGTVITGVPDGMSKKEVLRRYRKKFSEPTQFEKDAQAIKDTSAVDLAFGSAPGRFISGAADIGVGGLQLGARLLPGNTASDYMDRVVKEREEATRRGDMAYGREGFDWMRLGGNIGLGAAVAPALAGETMTAKILGGGLLGGAFGAGAPVENTDEYWKTKGIQTAIGLGLGVGVPVAGEGLKAGSKWLYHMGEPIFEKGKEAIKAREYLHAAGDRADAVLQGLKNAKELVPGSKPTAGEAAAVAGKAEFAGLQSRMSGHKPSEYLDRLNDQQRARSASLGTIAKTEADLKSAIAARESAGKANYGAAWAKKVNADGELIGIAQSPYFDTAYRDAVKIAQTENIPQTSVQFLHLVKRGMDKLLSKDNSKPLGAEERRAVSGLKDRLVNWIEKRVPEYNNARTQFQLDSQPINRMRVGQELEKTLNQPISDVVETGSQRTGPWMAAQRDASSIIKKTGGDPRFGGLKEILTPSEMNRVDKITMDLARRAQYEQQARLGSGMTPKNIASAQVARESGSEGLPNLLHRGAMVLNSIIRRGQGKANEQLQEEMAMEMLDPKAVAKIMEKAMIPKGKIRKFVEFLSSNYTAGIVPTATYTSARNVDEKMRRAGILIH